MKNAIFWDIETQFVPHWKHITSGTEPSQLMLCNIWGFHGGDYEECHILGCSAVQPLKEPTFWRKVSPPSSGWQRLVTSNIPSWPILVTLMMQAICSAETLIFTRATWCNIPEDVILQKEHWHHTPQLWQTSNCKELHITKQCTYNYFLSSK
jgi:hypothetical protein